MLVCLVLALILLAPVDRTPYPEMDYYRQTMERLEDLEIAGSSAGDTLVVGWAKINLTPDQPVPLAGYGKRRGAHYTQVHDSIYVRAFVFSNGAHKAVYLTADLLIIPPLVYEALLEKLNGSGFGPDNLHLTATHSHSSIGGWQPGFVGSLFSGEFDPAIVDFIAQKMADAILSAESRLVKARVGFTAIQAQNLVRNRLVGDMEGVVDPWFRMMKIVRDDGSTALLTSYAAHATCLGGSFMQLSGDYPGALVRAIEADTSIDFAAFGAGAMGSMAPLAPPLSDLEEIDYMTDNLIDQIMLLQSVIPINYTTELKSSRLSVGMREPHFRIATHTRLRPWVFQQVFGEVQPSINSLQIGSQLIIGTPCDFSGELIDTIDQRLKAEGIYPMVHSFNGAYLGYITKDQWYDRNKYETRTMNWFGPYNGSYFSELIDSVANKTVRAR